ncbi:MULTISPECIES: hypothetical protein [Paraburkholderia]|uniref:hypothetical protein n=1 Tax=Paraburkholderia TaxID=1822464 RepID=UPI002AAF5AB7|nr:MULTISPECIES: hypothetical protein [Paraburkholderia]
MQISKKLFSQFFENLIALIPELAFIIPVLLPQPGGGISPPMTHAPEPQSRSAYLPQTDPTTEREYHSVSKHPEARLTSANIVGLALANTVEFFDFFIYAMFAGYVARAFFPQGIFASVDALSSRRFLRRAPDHEMR